MEERTKGKMEPELGKLEPSSPGMGLEVPGQQCLLNRKMEQTTVDDCSLVDGSSDLGKTTFSLEKFVVGMKIDSQTSTSFASSKTQMSCKPKDKELANRQNKQLDPGGKEGEPPL